jgi:hypothetical protein
MRLAPMCRNSPPEVIGAPSVIANEIQSCIDHDNRAFVEDQTKKLFVALAEHNERNQRRLDLYLSLNPFPPVQNAPENQKDFRSKSQMEIENFAWMASR